MIKSFAGWFAGTLSAAVIATSAPAQAGLIIADFSTTLSLISGTDSVGLNGATVTLHAEFDDASTFTDFFGFPTVLALTHTITISGASVAGSNGTFSDPEGLRYFPTFVNGFFDGAGSFLGGGPLMEIIMEMSDGSVIPSNGDTISVDNFNTANLDPFDVPTRATDFSSYDWSTAATLTITTRPDVVAVPEPGTLGLIGLGMIGLAAVRRKKAA
jgi:hypothetical protein